MATACRVCKAKDETIAAQRQTITLMADVIDDLRQRAGSGPVSGPVLPLDTYSTGERMWASDEEEEITAALEAGSMSTDAAEKALAAIQAFNTDVHVVR